MRLLCRADIDAFTTTADCASRKAKLPSPPWTRVDRGAPKGRNIGVRDLQRKTEADQGRSLPTTRDWWIAALARAHCAKKTSSPRFRHLFCVRITRIHIIGV
jgi:hypothetical protein